MLGLFASENVKAHSDSCFNDTVLEPSFIAFSTDKTSSLANWYKKTFDLKIVKEFTAPYGRFSGVLMKNREFVVEVFQHQNVLDRTDMAPKKPLTGWRGFMKFGVYTNADLKVLKSCLVDKGVKAGRIYNDENLKLDLLHVYDPEGNSLEIMSRHKQST